MTSKRKEAVKNRGGKAALTRRPKIRRLKKETRMKERSQVDLSMKVSPPAIMEGLRRPWGVIHYHYSEDRTGKERSPSYTERRMRTALLPLPVLPITAT